MKTASHGYRHDHASYQSTHSQQVAPTPDRHPETMICLASSYEDGITSGSVQPAGSTNTLPASRNHDLPGQLS